MDYFKPIIVPLLDIITKELLDESLVDNKTQSKLFNYNESVIKFPTLIKWAETISKVSLHKLGTVKIFTTASKNIGLLHIDHHSTSRIGLNLPVLNGQGTRFEYYETPEDNLIENIGESSKGYGISLKPKELHLITKVSDLELITPHLIRTDRLHRAVNWTKDTRIIASLRWEANRHLTKFEDFVNVIL